MMFMYAGVFALLTFDCSLGSRIGFGMGFLCCAFNEAQLFMKIPTKTKKLSL